MATRGSGSSAAIHGYRPPDSANVEGGIAHPQTRASSHASILVHVGDKENHGRWARIKHKTKEVLRRRKKEGTHHQSRSVVVHIE